MNVATFRLALRQPDAWELLTEAQQTAVRTYIEEDGSLSATAAKLGVSREAVRKHLRYALKKFKAFAEAITE